MSQFTAVRGDLATLGAGSAIDAAIAGDGGLLTRLNDVYSGKCWGNWVRRGTCFVRQIPTAEIYQERSGASNSRGLGGVRSARKFWPGQLCRQTLW